MTRDVSGGQLSFWYRVSSEANYDFFNFYIDETRVIHVAGNGSWQYYSTTLPAGSYELKWEYDKDVNTSHYNDTAYIDDLELTDDQTTWQDIIALTAPGATSTPWTPTATGTARRVMATLAVMPSISSMKTTMGTSPKTKCPKSFGNASLPPTPTGTVRFRSRN